MGANTRGEGECLKGGHSFTARRPAREPPMDVDDTGEVETSAAEADMDGGDLFERLDAMSKAAVMAPEDDLILRMGAVSKLRTARSKEKKASSSTSGLAKPKSAIGKRRDRRRASDSPRKLTPRVAPSAGD